MAWLRPTLPVPGSEIGGETFDTAFGDPDVAPVARADPLVCDMAPSRMGMMMSAFDTMDTVKRDAPEKLKVGAEKAGNIVVQIRVRRNSVHLGGMLSSPRAQRIGG